MIRKAIVKGNDITGDKIARYLPGNYSVVGESIENDDPLDDIVYIEGEDSCGWTMDDYVIPRLASGLWWATEVDN